MASAPIEVRLWQARPAFLFSFPLAQPKSPRPAAGSGDEAGTTLAAISGMVRWALLSVLVLLPSTACDEARDPSKGRVSDAAVEPDGGHPDPPDLTGSYKLTLPTSGGSSRELHLYLVREPAGSYMARFDQGCSVERHEQALNMPGCKLDFVVPYRSEMSGDIFRDPSIALSKAGQITGVAHARYQRYYYGMMIGDSTIEGSIEASEAAPELQVVGAVTTRRVVLPWDTFAFAFGHELAIDRDRLATELTVKVTDGDTLSPNWNFAPAPEDSPDVGAARAVARFAWDDISGRELTFTLAEGVPDFVGLRSASETSSRIAVANVAAPAKGWSFDGAEPAVTTWASTSLVHGTSACDGSCLQLGPPFVDCAGPGFAGRLDTRGASKVIVRVRPTFPPGSSTGVRIAMGATELKNVATRDFNAGGAAQTGGWEEITVALSDELRAADVGFELQTTARCPYDVGADSYPDTSLLVDSVAVE
jgi:hypothetical protein